MDKIIAFIPVRGGSKSIPLKNIKSFCGQPLVYWVINSLQKSLMIDEIIIATDSKEIEHVVLSFNFSKVKIFHRSIVNSTDNSSTESVMIEYIINVSLPTNTTFLLVQATSPLTETRHFEEALELFKHKNFDSVLTCVRNYRFFWNENGTSINYNIYNRPRRQEFNGALMENGAFYINSVKNIIESNNRLSGKIGIYEMPQHTAFEIDEPDDWIILESLMFKYVLKQTLRKNVKLFLTDVDGVLTDCGMYYSEGGDELKKFNTRDGAGFQLLREAGIKTGIITSENTKIVENRARKLKVDYLYQGKRDGGKLSAAKEICRIEKIQLSEVAYIGDDINCFKILTNVGLKACPSDACGKVKLIPGINILKLKGGEGVVRDFVDSYKS